MRWQCWVLLFIPMFLFGPTHTWGQAQVPCPGLANGTPSFNNRVICTLPQLYGPQALQVGVPAPPFFSPTLQASAPAYFASPIGASYVETITSQIVSLPLVAPTAGISLVLDRSLGVFVPSNDSFGPIFSERASTIGKNRLGVGLSYQHMNFDSLDGIDLHSFPNLFVQHGDAWAVTPYEQYYCNPVTNVPSCSRGSHDYLTALDRIDLHISQYTAFATFGVTKRIDLSVAVPVLTVSMSAVADTNIVANSNVLGGLSFNTAALHLTCLTHSGPQNSQYCSEALDFNSQRSSGMGDLTVRVKGVLKSWERAALAAGLDIRVPTGDEMNLLGTGAVGIRPFLVWSRGGRVSPHVNFGYQWNGRSILASDIYAGSYVGDTSRYYLPREVLYSLGVEAAMTTRLTAALDLVGQTVINGSRVRLIEALAPGICPVTSSSPTPSDTCADAGPPVKQETAATYKGTYAIDNASLGLRYRPFGRFLLSANVLLKVDNGGLRSKAIPTVSATYTLW